MVPCIVRATKELIRKVTRLREVEMVRLVFLKCLVEVKTRYEMHPSMAKPTTNDLLPQKQNMFY